MCYSIFFLKVPYEDLLDASELLIKALTLRRDYCRSAAHSFPSTTARFLHTNEQNGIADVETVHEEKKTVEGKYMLFVYRCETKVL